MDSEDSLTSEDSDCESDSSSEVQQNKKVNFGKSGEEPGGPSLKRRPGMGCVPSCVTKGRNPLNKVYIYIK